MTEVHIKVPRSLFDSMQSDLERQHPFAFERVGFAFGRQAAIAGDAMSVILTDYEPVPDAYYVEDHHVGARIGGDAIRSAMQRAMRDEVSVFHVHAHFGPFEPGFSTTDLEGYTRLLPSLATVAPRQCHGALLLTPGPAIGLFRRGSDLIATASVKIIGFPMNVWRRS